MTGRKSSITRLPLPVKRAIDEALKTGRFTLDELRASITAEFGPEVVPSRSSLGRYSQRFEEIGKRMRESREVAQVWADRLGHEPQGDIGKLVMDLLRTMAFDATLAMSEEGEDGEGKAVSPKEINALALAMHRLETAGRHNLEREQAMRKAAFEEAAKVASTAAKKKGMTPELVESIKASILGIAQ
jgi:hypothetical protein